MARRASPPLDPRAFTRIVGATFGNHDHRPLITIGSRTWSRWQLGLLGCPHPSAATRVAQMIARLDIRTPAEFIKRVPEFGLYKTLGVTCYWLVLALARDCGADIESAHGSDRSFAAIHRKVLIEEKPSRRTRAPRRRAS